MLSMPQMSHIIIIIMAKFTNLPALFAACKRLGLAESVQERAHRVAQVLWLAGWRAVRRWVAYFGVLPEARDHLGDGDGGRGKDRWSLRRGGALSEASGVSYKNSAGRTRTYNQPVNSRLLYH